MRKEQQVEARRRARILTGKHWHNRDVAVAVGVHERTVRQWQQQQREHGTKSLLRDERGRAAGDGRTLTAAQEKEVRKLIADKLPDQLQLPFALWTRKAVAQLLESRFGLKLPVRTMGEYRFLVLQTTRPDPQLLRLRHRPRRRLMALSHCRINSASALGRAPANLAPTPFTGYLPPCLWKN